MKRIRPIQARIGRTSGATASPEAQMRRFGTVLRRYRNAEWADVSRYEPILSRCEPVAGNDYDLSLNRYKEVVHEVVEHDSPQEILERLATLEEEIASGRKKLEGLLKWLSNTNRSKASVKSSWDKRLQANHITNRVKVGLW